MPSKSNASLPRSKPAKPCPDFPLFAHPSGQWARKINRKLVYFGTWDRAEEALLRHNREYPFLKAGRVPPPADAGDACTLRVLANAFLGAKEAKLDAPPPRGVRDACRLHRDPRPRSDLPGRRVLGRRDPVQDRRAGGHLPRPGRRRDRGRPPAEEMTTAFSGFRDRPSTDCILVIPTVRIVL